MKLEPKAIFYNQIGKFDKNNEFQINLQNIKGDNYLKNHKLSDNSKLIKNDDLLISNIDINWNFENQDLILLLKYLKIYQEIVATDINIFFGL